MRQTETEYNIYAIMTIDDHIHPTVMAVLEHYAAKGSNRQADAACAALTALVGCYRNPRLLRPIAHVHTGQKPGPGAAPVLFRIYPLHGFELIIADFDRGDGFFLAIYFGPRNSYDERERLIKNELKELWRSV